MSIRNPDSWAELLLDLGKRNRLIHFKESGTAEVLLPGVASVLERAENGDALSVYDPKLPECAEDAEASEPVSEESDSRRVGYLRTHEKKLKKAKQLLLYTRTGDPLRVLNDIRKKANTVLEETGVNVAYMTFGLLHWSEEDAPDARYAAPLLMLPIRIEHPSAVSPFTVRFEEDTPLVNPTLAFKLASERSVELPEYAHEGFEAYVSRVGAIAAALGWEITRECRIGLFSFQKINMYRDLTDHRETVLAHPHVQRLLGVAYDGEPNGGAAESVTDTASLGTVVDADSSQLEAIGMAKAGKSFVLQGPPGSGKSQTITNIIAQLLHDGRRVLFVSEKQAALEVVYEKLKAAGLEEFCLELHSHKSNKKQVIEKLCRTLRAEKSGVAKRAESDLAEWQSTEEMLTAYTEALHREQPVIGQSLYRLFEDYTAACDAPDCEVEIPNVGEKSREYLATAEKLMAQYAAFVGDLGEDWRQNAWYGYRGTDASHRVETALRRDLRTLADTALALRLLPRPTSGEGEPYATLAEAQDCRALCRLVTETEILTPALFENSVLCHVVEVLTELRRMAGSIELLRAALLSQHREEILSLSGAMGYKKLLERQSALLPRVFSKQYRDLVRAIKTTRLDGKRPTYVEALSAMELLSTYQAQMKDYTAREETVRSLLGAAYRGPETDWDALLSELGVLAGIVGRMGDSATLVRMTASDFDAYRRTCADAAKELDACLLPAEDACRRIAEAFDPTVLDPREMPLTALAERCEACLTTFSQFGTWCRFRALLDEMEQQELMPFVLDLLARKLPADSLSALYRKAFYRQWIETVLERTPSLAAFSRIAHDQAAAIFTQKDIDRFAIARAEIRALLSARRPATDLLTPDSTVAMLLREGEKKRRQKSIRTLLSEAGELIAVLTPCFLMSPLSVSTFLSTDAPQFDTVIFDEASQIFPQDAIGAIYRAKQLIVVGDSRQMPPSDFFTATVGTNTETDSEEVSDYESILDLCAATLPQISLKWHYRSRDESLIAFSNEAFYRGELVTFPSAKHGGEGLGVEHHLVDGIFEHGKRTNLAEAEYAVELIYRHATAYPERSLGVVAFSVAQQDLIDRLLMKRRRADPSLEDFFSADRPEPFFIKNLETVQGDERDTIIFSVAYGKDAKGKLLQNFGPLNRMGGERRLNVAVTRAKYHVQVISSIRGADIEAPFDYMNGVRALKEYLDYAERQSAPLPTVDLPESVFADSSFALEESIAAFLESNGYQTETRVGSSAYPVDVAVKDPETGDYLLAVECDGENYYRFGNTRDRNRLRPTVLERMGWRHYRIWSVDWYRNPDMEKKRLLAALAPDTEEDSKADFVSAPQDATEADPTPRVYEQMHYDEPFSFPTYREADMPLLSHRYGTDLRKIIPLMLETEAPLSEKWMLSRLAPLFGSERVTSEVVEAYRAFFSSIQAMNVVRKNGFLYLRDQTEIAFRVPRRMPRDVAYVAPEELAVGMLEILKRNHAVERHTLYLMLIKLLGFHRVSKSVAEQMERALALLTERVECNGETVRLKDTAPKNGQA